MKVFSVVPLNKANKDSKKHQVSLSVNKYFWDSFIKCATIVALAHQRLNVAYCLDSKASHLANINRLSYISNNWNH